MRTLAIDLGTRRIGLAMSDEGGRFATPHSVLKVTSPEQAIDPILKLIRLEDVKRVLVGLPLNMDGTFGAQAKQAVEWASRLKSWTSVDLLFVDERLSSFEAEQQLRDRKRGGEKLTRRLKKEQLDALAAASFLQSFLDGKLGSIDPTQR